MNLAQAQSDNQAQSLLSMNRSKLRKAFNSHTQKDGKLSVPGCLKLCRNLKIFPDLLSSMDLNRILKQGSFSSGILYPNFQLLLKVLASHCFNTGASLGQKLRMLLIHVRNSFKKHYQAILTFHARNSSTKSPQEKKNINRVKGSYKTISLARYASSSPMKQEEQSPKHDKARFSQDCSLELKPSLKKIKNSVLSQTFSNLLAKQTFSPSSREQPVSVQPTAHNRAYSGASLNLSKSISKLERNKELTPRKESVTPDLTTLFNQFKQNHNQLSLQGPKIAQSKDKMKKQQKFIQGVRERMFTGDFVLPILFGAWRGLVRKG